MKKVLALVQKDYQIDFRQKYPIAGIALYIFATIYISYLAFKNSISPTTWNALFWMIVLFSSITGLVKGFSQEQDRSGYYYFLARSWQILLAKVIYNLVYQLVMVLFTMVLFSTFLGNPIENYSGFILNLFLGSIGLAFSFTLTSSIASKSENSSTMMAILSFPVIVPVLLLAVTNSRKLVLGANWSDVSGNSVTLISVNVVIIALSFILFPYSWRN